MTGSSTNLQVPTRRANTWPRHVAKERDRKRNRKRNAQAGQQATDAALNRRNY